MHDSQTLMDIFPTKKKILVSSSVIDSYYTATIKNSQNFEKF